MLIKASYCQGCTQAKANQIDADFEKWFGDHKEDCAANYRGSAGKMEVDAIKEMFLSSEEKFQVKYGNYIDEATQ